MISNLRPTGSIVTLYNLSTLMKWLRTTGSSQNLSHFRSCEGGTVMLKFHLAQRIHIPIISPAPLCAGDVFKPGRIQAETGLTIGKDPGTLVCLRISFISRSS